MRRTFFFYALSIGFIACGGNNAAPDAPPNKLDAAVDAPSNIDAAEPPLTLNNDEGGEIRLEWIQKGSGSAVTTTARATAFFYKSETPATNPLPSFPGCVDTSSGTFPDWPLAQGAITPLDVGDVIIHTSTADISLTRDNGGGGDGTATGNEPCALGSDGVTYACPTGVSGKCNAAHLCATLDPLGRPHDLWWKRPATFTATDGDLYPADESYNVVFTGSSEWPAQAFDGALGQAGYMPSNWVPAAPNPPGTPIQFTANTPMTLSFAADASTNLPPGYVVNTAIAFKGPFAYPIVICQFDGTPATITIPADIVNVLVAYGAGTISRQHLTHHLQELTDGSPRPTADRKRIDMLTVWCYTDNWTAM